MSTKGKSSGFYKKPPKSQTTTGDILLPKRTKGQEIPLTTVGGAGSITEALETLMTRLLKIETEHPGLAMATIDEETHRYMEIPQDMDSTYVHPQAIGTSINEYLMKSSRNAKDKADVLMKLSRFLTRARKDNQTDILKYYQRIATTLENFIREKQPQLPPSNDEPGCTSITELEAAVTQGLSIDSENLTIEQQQPQPSKHRQKKKSQLATMSTDQCQIHPEQQQQQGKPHEKPTVEKQQQKPSVSFKLLVQEKPTVEKQQQKPSKRRQRKKSLLPAMSTDGCQTDQPEQQDSSTRIQRLPVKQRWANYKREIKENRIKVVKLSAGGFIKHVYIPTRSQWLKMCRGEWGATEKETVAFIKDVTKGVYNIEVCGSHQGYAVIIRDSVRNPILAISRVAEDYVSPFYHELQGVSLALKLAMKYKIYSFIFYCISEDIHEYVTLNWCRKRWCDCPPRDNPRNPGEKLDYCVRCLSYTIDEIDEGSNADKILSLIDEIFSDALEFERQGYRWFDLWLATATELCAKAVQHLANSGIDQDLRVDEIEEDEELAEILYKEVFGHEYER